MYDCFTERARHVLVCADQEARRFNHEYIGTEHILLGLVKEGSGVGARVLKNLDVELRTIRLRIERFVGLGPDIVIASMLPQTPRAKRVIEHAIAQSRALRHCHVGTEHLLLGLLREEDGVAAQVLLMSGLSLVELQAETVRLLGFGTVPDQPAKSGPAAEERANRLAELHLQLTAAIHARDYERVAAMRHEMDRLREQARGELRDWLAGRDVDPRWLAWHDGAVIRIARTIYANRRWDELPILADALEEAGCHDEDVLDHCRHPSRHISTCWLLELLLRSR